MNSYKNMTQFTKTVYGVKFKPGEVHEVPGYINVPGFISCPRVEADTATAAAVEQTPAKKTATKAAAKTTTEEVQ